MTTNRVKSILRWLILPVLSLVCWSTTLLPCQGSEARYHVIKMIEGSGTTAPEAGGINQKGQAVGSMDTFGGSQFWLWSDGVRQDLSPGTNRNCYAKVLNNQGQVVGGFHTGEYGVDFWGIVYPIYHAFVWTAGSLQELGTLGGESSTALWINDQGVVLGAADTTNDFIPFIARNGQMRSLQSLMLNPSGWKLALETHYVAADGRIWGLGTRGGKHHIYEMAPETNGMYRIRSRGVIETIDIVKVFAFNEYGQAVGITRLSADKGPAFFWDERGIAVLADLGRPGTFPDGINNLGQVVGLSMTESQGNNAFLWKAGAMSNLNDLIPSDSGILLTEAKAINDSGNIVCIYRNISSGFYGVCVLTPVAPLPLEITEYEMTPDGMSLEVQGGGGQFLSLEYTSDWKQWTTLATSTNLFGRRVFIDPDAKSSNFRA